MIKKILLVIIFSQFISNCGFTPTLKTLDDSQSSSDVFYQIDSGSYLAKQTFRTLFKNIDKSKANYIAKINITESESAVNILSNGSVSEYKVEVLFKYKLVYAHNNELIQDSLTRGFANYDVSSSEYTNNLVKNEALKTAINEAAQLMSIIIKGKISK
jgi:hydroxymethylpyrimidine/phosphomethylpyrimidine kinase